MGLFYYGSDTNFASHDLGFPVRTVQFVKAAEVLIRNHTCTVHFLRASLDTASHLELACLGAAHVRRSCLSTAMMIILELLGRLMGH